MQVDIPPAVENEELDNSDEEAESSSWEVKYKTLKVKFIELKKRSETIATGNCSLDGEHVSFAIQLYTIYKTCNNLYKPSQLTNQNLEWCHRN